MNFKDITGQMFGHLTACAVNVGKSHSKSTYWYCVCDCGTVTTVSLANLISGNVKSCGCSKSHKMDGGMVAFNAILGTYKNNARKRGFIWNLSDEDFWFLTSQECHYCGNPSSNKYRTKKGELYAYNGIDRVNSNVGYSIENCVPCCKICNRLKMDLGYSEFLEHLERIYNYQGIAALRSLSKAGLSY